jgi:hypothetical protein
MSNSPPSGGKYLAPDERVVMFDGTIKEARDIRQGDLLMGDDSTSRTVLVTTSGVGEMFRIVPIKGEPYVVHGSHRIALVSTSKPMLVPWTDGRYKVMWVESGIQKSKSFRPINEENRQRATDFMPTVRQVDYFDITVNEYINKSNWWKALYKGYRIGIDWPYQEVPLDPYLLGAWLGDGTSSKPEITNVDEEIVDYLEEAYNEMGLVMTSRPSKPITHYATKQNWSRNDPNMFMQALRWLNVLNNKHIPHIYKINSRNFRLALLAGLLDTDGTYSNNVYGIVQKRKELLYDIAFVARSLGFRATVNEVQRTCTNAPGGPKTGTYYQCYIGGSGLEEIPTKLARKQAHERLDPRDALRTGFSIESLGPRYYCGFQLDGNHCLLKDFTVS